MWLSNKKHSWKNSMGVQNRWNNSFHNPNRSIGKKTRQLHLDSALSTPS